MNEKINKYCLARIKGSDEPFGIYVRHYSGEYYSFIINPFALKESDLEIKHYLEPENKSINDYFGK